MDAVGLVIAVAGIATAILCWFFIRASQISFGYGAFWILVGVLLCALGIADRWITGWLESIGLAHGDRLWLVALVLVMLAGLIRQAWQLSRARERARDLSREIALQRHEIDQGRDETNG